jgi:hypothetical protein
MNDLDQIEQLSENIQSLVNTKVELFKLQSLEIMANAFAVLFKKLLLCLIFLLTLLFVSLGLSNYLCYKLNSPFIGYYLVGGGYLIILLIILLDRIGFIESVVLNKILGYFLNTKSS